MAGLVHRRRSFVLAATGLVLALVAVVVVCRCFAPLARGAAATSLLLQSRNALQREKFNLAEDLARHIDPDDESWAAGRLVAGEAAMRGGRTEAAIAYYSSVPRDGSQTARIAALSQGELARDLGRLADAEREYLYVLDREPANFLARERMAFLLGVTGRRWQSSPHFLFLARNGVATWEQLVLLGDLERPMRQAEYLKRCAADAPDDFLVRLGLAALAVSEGQASDARSLLREVVDRAPGLFAAQAMLGELLLDADGATFFDWHGDLSPAADGDPDIWYVRGLWARRHGELRTAARCFWECVGRAPTHRRGNYQLGQVLISLGETSGQDFAERSGKFFELTKMLDTVLKSEGQSEAAMRRVAELMETTGRVLEACAWAVVAAQEFPSADWPESTFVRLSPLLGPKTPQTLDSANLALKFDLSRFPGHESLFREIDRGRSREPLLTRQSSIRFEEEFGAGVDFVYLNGADSTTKGARMFEQTGGGVAVIDYDGDGWPDLYFTQGAPWPQGSKKPILSDHTTDRLYRNVAGQAFVDITREARLVDRGFGQGCAAGDFDDDGFSDLYVANIGRNQLHRNNGDGTFSDVTDECGIEGETWTTSCLIVDMNADGLPDLFDVTYVTGPNVYEAVCNGHACSPKTFEGIPDRLHLSRGDGSFALAPHAASEPNSKGLGVVAFDFAARGLPSLFVANDQVPNFLMRSSASNDRFNVRLEDEGFASGLAFNEDGLAMAGMGIAADDVNGDGRIDFYVTTFKDESKILYLQDAAGLFIDATNAAGLRSASLAFVGWGTQFLDADRDGEPDLVVANGHVDDYRAEGGEYQMRPQFFWNTGGGRFAELFAGEAGGYFGRKYLGRGLARLDWNRDGKMDFVVSNIGDRASLVTNRSTGAGHFVSVRLHASATARDAIGAVVEVATDQRRWSKELVAGDGYMASNERVLQFGLGVAAFVIELRVRWPSGSTTILRGLPVDGTLELVEGASRRAVWRGSDLDAHPLGETIVIEEEPSRAP